MDFLAGGSSILLFLRSMYPIIFTLLFSGIFFFTETMAQKPLPVNPSIYQIYPRSFFDSNGDGIGDIPGIIAKLDYIRDLGFEGIWCSPFFVSPQQDFGYDISDYQNIAPEYGTMEDVERLIETVHQKGMFILFDMVMNHTSLEHPWFKESASSKDNAKADWYLWRDKPNNWMSLTGGSGWHYHEGRKQYFYASFLPFQPDLNYRNPEVKATMLRTAQFWLGKGVDGFRLDIFNVIYKDGQFRNNPFAFKVVPNEDDPSGFFQKFNYTINQPESVQFAEELRAASDSFGHPILLGEVSGNMETIRKYLGNGKNGLSHVFVFHMLPFKFKAKWFEALIGKMEKVFPAPLEPVYVFSNHDRRRSIARIGNNEQRAKVLHTLQLVMRGTPVMYYGEEIGMTEIKMKRKTALDPIAHKFKHVPKGFDLLIGETLNRDECRLPMQWSNSPQAGFSTSSRTWLPLHPDYPGKNVKEAQEREYSLWNCIRRLNALRKESEVLRKGSMQLNREDEVLEVLRTDGHQTWKVYLNFGKKETRINTEGKMLYRTEAAIAVNGNQLVLPGYSAVVLDLGTAKP